ncbi:acyl-CoA thioesterase [Marinomonas mediterranea]|uniref:acyl-CoA thioesterase n=1 Tax=Marinomonas mediterranea TaxID=119864 RepID=UPI002349ED97|nr:thioesterase family protein [Marinomonas mediterranea]WCN09351.1 acyl-CoA thioesterase [Marinomonas mediterranea]
MTQQIPESSAAAQKNTLVDAIHTIDIQVRDYECDMQGIVNNAVYQNYLEHARHEFIKTKGLDFAEITSRGIHLVVIKAEIEYKASLRSGMVARVSTQGKRLSKFKAVFEQTIVVDHPDNEEPAKICTLAQIYIASISDNGKPVRCPEMDQLFS